MGEYIATEFQVFIANLKVLAGVILLLSVQLVVTFRANKTVSYTALQTDYVLMANQSNWWSSANTLRSVSSITILSVAFVTQALSLYGQLGYVNLMVWIYVVGIGGTFLTFVYLMLLAIAYEVCFNNLYGPY